jgi:hypothetical protein
MRNDQEEQDLERENLGDAIIRKPGTWAPGQSGNPNGRPVGIRQTFTTAFLKDLRDIWHNHGKAAMERTAQLEPTVFFGTCARLIPKDVQQTIE